MQVALFEAVAKQKQLLHNRYSAETDVGRQAHPP